MKNSLSCIEWNQCSDNYLNCTIMCNFGYQRNTSVRQIYRDINQIAVKWLIGFLFIYLEVQHVYISHFIMVKLIANDQIYKNCFNIHIFFLFFQFEQFIYSYLQNPISFTAGGGQRTFLNIKIWYVSCVHHTTFTHHLILNRNRYFYA